MDVIITFLNLVAVVVFVIGGLWALWTFMFAVLNAYHPLTTLEEKFQGKRYTFPWVKRSILPTIALMWLIASYTTGNFFGW